MIRSKKIESYTPSVSPIEKAFEDEDNNIREVLKKRTLIVYVIMTIFGLFMIDVVYESY